MRVTTKALTRLLEAAVEADDAEWEHDDGSWAEELDVPHQVLDSAMCTVAEVVCAHEPGARGELMALAPVLAREVLELRLEVAKLRTVSPCARACSSKR